MGERERNILFISSTFGYGAQKNRLNETVPFIIYVLVDKKEVIFYHAHFHVGYLDACEKTVYILSDNHIL